MSAKPYRYLRAHHAAAGSTGFLKTSLSPKRALCSQSGVFEYQRKRQPRLGADIETLEAWLAAEEKLPSRERRTAQRLYEAPCLEGYAGAVDAERRHEREFGRRRHPVNTVFIPQSFAPGEAYRMCNHYLVDPTACTPAAGWEKGQVENQVGNVQVRVAYIENPGNFVPTAENPNAYGYIRHPDREPRLHPAVSASCGHRFTVLG